MKIKKMAMYIVYGVSVIALTIAMYYAGEAANRYLFGTGDDVEYVDEEIIEDLERNIPVVGITSTIVKPYLDENVKIVNDFYDYQANDDSQEKAIIFFEDTYMQNSGVDYSSDDKFDVISVLDGTVISIKEDNIMGTTIEIRHSNNLISVYQSLSEVVVKEGESVMQGQVIAKSGKSNINKELENHLHFELYYNGIIVNPEEYYNREISELEQ